MTEWALSDPLARPPRGPSHSPEAEAQRVARGKYAIEHIMPRKWTAHWPLPPGVGTDAERDRLLHTVGNLAVDAADEDTDDDGDEDEG